MPQVIPSNATGFNGIYLSDARVLVIKLSNRYSSQLALSSTESSPMPAMRLLRSGGTAFFSEVEFGWLDLPGSVKLIARDSPEATETRE